jgi:hypothetical protein
MLQNAFVHWQCEQRRMHVRVHYAQQCANALDVRIRAQEQQSLAICLAAGDAIRMAPVGGAPLAHISPAAAPPSREQQDFVEEDVSIKPAFPDVGISWHSAPQVQCKPPIFLPTSTAEGPRPRGLQLAAPAHVCGSPRRALAVHKGMLGRASLMQPSGAFTGIASSLLPCGPAARRTPPSHATRVLLVLQHRRALPRHRPVHSFDFGETASASAFSAPPPRQALLQEPLWPAAGVSTQAAAPVGAPAAGGGARAVAGDGRLFSWETEDMAAAVAGMSGAEATRAAPAAFDACGKLWSWEGALCIPPVADPAPWRPPAGAAASALQPDRRGAPLSGSVAAPAFAASVPAFASSDQYRQAAHRKNMYSWEAVDLATGAAAARGAAAEHRSAPPFPMLPQAQVDNLSGPEQLFGIAANGPSWAASVSRRVP